MSRRISVFFPKELFNDNRRDSWFELIKSKERLEKTGRNVDKAIQSMLDFVDDKNLADVWILPMDWNYYYQNNNHQKALEFCEEGDRLDKTILSFTGGDQGITVPSPLSTIIYRQSGYRSKLRKNERTAPFFLSDPVGKFVLNEEELFANEKVHLTVVGFCGMAPHGIKTAIKERLQTIYRNLKSQLGKSPFDKQAVLSTSTLRFKVLEIFDNNKEFKSNYIIRQKYRGGEPTKENRHKTTLEYYKNQLESDLVVCVRGVGNFSLRFYETLAMGGIPVFIDTDSPLPEIGEKKWEDYIIRVNSSELAKADEIAISWLKDKDLMEQKKKSRKLWKEHFSLEGFWKNEINTIKQLVG